MLKKKSAQEIEKIKADKKAIDDVVNLTRQMSKLADANSVFTPQTAWNTDDWKTQWDKDS